MTHLRGASAGQPPRAQSASCVRRFAGNSWSRTMVPAGAGDSRGRESGNTTSLGEDGLDVWSQLLLNRAQDASGSDTGGQKKTVVVLGDDQSGKSTLVSRMFSQTTGSADDETSHGLLEYVSYDVKHHSGKTVGLDVWTLDGCEDVEELLDTVVTSKTISSLAFVVVVDLARPWNVSSSLSRWLSVARTKADAAWAARGADETATARTAIENHFKSRRFERVDNVASGGHKNSDGGGGLEKNGGGSGSGLRGNEETPAGGAVRAAAEVMETSGIGRKDGDDEGAIKVDDLPLPEGALETNTGVPMVVVATRSDMLFSEWHSLNFGLGPGQHDLVQQHLRRSALTYGAAVVYTNALSSAKNCHVLIDYILHRVAGVDFAHDADEVNEQQLFIPAGLDTKKKIDGISLHGGTIEANIPRPSKKSEAPPQKAPDFQEFLVSEEKRLSSLPKADDATSIMRKNAETLIYDSHKQSVAGGRLGDSGGGNGAMSIHKLSAGGGGAGSSGGAGVATGAAGGPGATGGGGSDTTMAADFFRNILSNKRTGGVGGRLTGGGETSAAGGGALSGATSVDDKTRAFLEKLKNKKRAGGGGSIG